MKAELRTDPKWSLFGLIAKLCSFMKHTSGIKVYFLSLDNFSIPSIENRFDKQAIFQDDNTSSHSEEDQSFSLRKAYQRK